ncbi:hydroxymethylglutaryl-CoA reductase (NADPH) [Catalinimonas alkaloidigena]|uniref:hydroxymethylglutaryl-CoA reductase (NADPH) n=1 Tax=Catalinimonas alkaloidigena TaxID=1075417 RepID=A0A1G9RFU7_9BACT|nr:hydroxymethylglutaryl-CoA reductase [Catalinimonas alkaloidigena]SDM22192.1 hydroxymethylglutaryl-CoA reductase (NADPH) [Catalinimonas alkaloidigena]
MFSLIPNALLKQLYTRGSLCNTAEGFCFSLKNRLTDARFTGLHSARIDGQSYAAEAFTLHSADAAPRSVADVTPACPLDFPLRRVVEIQATGAPLSPGRHHLEIVLQTEPFGKITLRVEDDVRPVATIHSEKKGIPRDSTDDYTTAALTERWRYLEQKTGHAPRHLAPAAYPWAAARGNCENLIGVAQVPVGVAGPLRINGEHAQGEFLIPLATTEGSLVASYNRGMKLINACGGVTCTVMDDAMQRAPVFELADARAARAFVQWVQAHGAELKAEAEATSHYARLHTIEPYLVGRLAFLRFNFTTGDAAGQNMVTKATLAACNWLIYNYDGIEHFYLESNMATDKKPSQLNTLQTRGKRVTAELTIPRAVLREVLQVEPEQIDRHSRIGQVGAWQAGANNNGLHSVNGLAALFIATGQDVACLAESSAAITYSEITPAGDLYGSITLPSLVVGTVGGGTGLPTQRECLELMGCYGPDQVYKFAEIVVGVIAAGELSLAAAISSLDWVASHESLGRNRHTGM